MNIEELATFCKRKGFVYPSSEIYGGLAGFWDFGPLGVELFNNLKAHWWHYFVKSKEHVIGIDGSIIANPQVWKASGHTDNFGDLIMTCSKCKQKLRADHFIEDKLNINVEGRPIEEINKIITENKLVCPECKGTFSEVKNFNLMFATQVGADESKSSQAYLRGETAQAMFTNFKLITETSRAQLPFGIAQVGTCFRNEIAPRDFMFRSREFTIGELEFFIHPEELTSSHLTDDHKNESFDLLDANAQEAEKSDLQKSSIKQLLDDKKLDEWHAYWLAEQLKWMRSIGLDKNLKIREHTKNELSHYSSSTFDIDYQFPFGSKEIAGNANRGQFDLQQHINASKAKLEVFDEASKQKVVPRVIEPTFGMTRVFLALICDALTYDERRKNNVLKLHPTLAPYTVAILPLVNKDAVSVKARELFAELSQELSCVYDKSGSIGRRYARNDEIGTPYCITIDFDGLENETVTIRDRDSAAQRRIEMGNILPTLQSLVKGETSFSTIGTEL